MKINEKNVTKMLGLFHEIYGDPENPIPENTPCIVYCSGSNTHGWIEINKTEDLGLEALIAKSWMTREEFLSL